MIDLLEFHRRTTEVTDSIVDKVTADLLDVPTPCAGWDLRQLLAHMIGQNRGFAAAARGTGPTLDVWADWPVGQDPAGDHRAVSADLLQAFAQPDAATRGWWLAEFSRERPFPPQQAVGFHLLDTMVHGWDVAVSIGVPVEFDDDLTAAVLKVARAVPDGPGRLQPNAAFRPGVPQPDDAAPLHRILAMLGRSPDWSPSSTGDETVQTD